MMPTLIAFRLTLGYPAMTQELLGTLFIATAQKQEVDLVTNMYRKDFTIVLQRSLMPF